MKISKSRVVFNVLNYSILGLFALMCLYPFWYILIYALSDPMEASKGIYFFIKKFTLSNFSKVFQLSGIYGAILVSVIRTIVGTAGTVLVSAFLGYLFSKREMFARTFFYRMVIITMYIGGGLIPVYLTYNAYGLADRFLVYILPSLVSAYNIILVKTYVEQLPDALQESAMIEGAGYFTVFRTIILPLCGPILATIAIFSAVGQWNAWMDNYLYVSKESLQTLQYTLYKFLSESTELAKRLEMGDKSAMNVLANEEGQLTPKTVRMTITFITILPIFCVYPFMQKYFTKGIMMGAVKG